MGTAMAQHSSAVTPGHGLIATYMVRLCPKCFQHLYRPSLWEQMKSPGQAAAKRTTGNQMQAGGSGEENSLLMQSKTPLLYKCAKERNRKMNGNTKDRKHSSSRKRTSKQHHRVMLPELHKRCSILKDEDLKVNVYISL